MVRCLKGTLGASHTSCSRSNRKLRGTIVIEQPLRRWLLYFSNFLFRATRLRFSSVRLTFRDCVELTVFQSFALIGVRESSKKKKKKKKRERKTRQECKRKKNFAGNLSFQLFFVRIDGIYRMFVSSIRVYTRIV